jgi:hypothetical protein
LIEHMGPAHCTVRVRVRRSPRTAVRNIRPVGRPVALEPVAIRPACCH